ncbi:hypothetical protein OAU50_02765 [Planctomycetota bacterium]|nr:hypothetical protein [Planctomycetota bacterium]
MTTDIKPALDLTRGSHVNFGGSIYHVTRVDFQPLQPGIPTVLILDLVWTGEGKNPGFVATSATIPNPETPVVVC